MTIKELEQYYTLNSEVKAIEEQIRLLYEPHIYAGGERIGSAPQTAGNPTENAAIKITDYKARLISKMGMLRKLADDIEAWLDSVPDSNVRAAIRWHYLNGLNWKNTNTRVYGYPDYQYARRKVIEYFEREGII